MSLTPTTQRMTKGTFPRGLARAWLLLLLLSTSFARGAAVPETDVKAAFLYNFAKFVEWPKEAFASETAPIQIAVFGDEEFSAKLKSLLNDKKAHGRSFEVKRITNPQEAKTVHMVFVPGSETRRTTQILEATRRLPVLTVGESDQFLDLGGMINFVFEDSQLRFQINPEPAEKAKLKISSQLLRLAKKWSPK